MGNWIKTVAILAIVALAGIAQAKEKGAGKVPAATDTTKGKIVMITLDKDKTDVYTISLEIGKGRKVQGVTITTDAKTQVTLDALTAKIVDLKVGQQVTVTPAQGLATKIEATSAPATKGKGKSKAGV